MKNIFRNIIFTTSLLLMVFISSCKKFLDREPISTPIEETFWQSQEDALAGLSGVYAQLREVYLEHMIIYGDWPAKIFDTDDYWNSMITSGDIGRRGWTDDKYGNWSKRYKLVNNANLVIDKISNIPDENFTDGVAVKRKYVAEAKFIRAFVYFNLVRNWGDVPLITKAIVTSQDAETLRNIPQNPEKDVLAQCLKDLQEAIPNLKWNWADESERCYRVNKAACFALMAHIYGWQNRPVNPNRVPADYEKMLAACDSVINSGNFAIETDMTQILKVFEEKTNDALFAIPCLDNNSEQFNGNGTESLALFQYMNKHMNMTLGDKAHTRLKAEYKTCFDTATDKRLKIYFYNFNDPSKCEIIKYSNITFKDREQKDSYFSQVFPVFRYTDVLLLRAEALYNLGREAEALNQLTEEASRFTTKAVSNNGNMTDLTGTDILKELWMERSREFILEGHLVYDMVRMGFYDAPSKFSTERYQLHGYLWPISMGVLMQNNQLKQTPYWLIKPVQLF